MSVGDSMG